MTDKAYPTTSGPGYFMQGFSLIMTPGLRSFVLIPLLVNLVLFSGAFYYLYLQIEPMMIWLQDWLPEWLSWLNYIIYPVAFISILAIFSFVFSTFANWIAAPFNGLLSEKTEQLLTGQSLAGGSAMDVVKDIPRTISREWTKLVYYIPKAIGFLIIFWFLPGIGQLIWLVFSAWMMAVQYCDYPFDNHKISFTEMRAQLKQHQGKAYGFGFTVTIFTMLPIINLVVMPVAICGSTAMWVKHFRHHYR